MCKMDEPTFVSKDDAAAQTEQAMKNMGAVLAAAGSSYEKVVKTTIMMANIDDFKAIDAAYGETSFPILTVQRADVRQVFPGECPGKSCFCCWCVANRSIG